MIGHHGEHVVLYMVVHVPIQEAHHRVQVNGPAVQPMVEHILGKSGVLGKAGCDVQPGSVHGWQWTRQQHRQDRPDLQGKGEHGQMNHEPDARRQVNLAALAFGNESRFLVA